MEWKRNDRKRRKRKSRRKTVNGGPFTEGGGGMFIYIKEWMKG